MFDVQIPHGQFSLAADRYVRELGASMPKVLRAQTRLMLRDILRFTPPKTLAQGRKAVAGDVGKAVSLLTVDSFDRMPQAAREQARKLIQARNPEALQEFLRRVGRNRMKFANVVPFSPNLHTSQRTKYGRVNSWRGNFTLDKANWNAYLKKIQGRVGWARAGWNQAARLVGFKMPSWVSRHGERGGSAIEVGGDKPLITIVHRASKIPSYPRSVRGAFLNRVRSMNRDVDRILRAVARGQTAQSATRLDIF